MFNIYRRAGGEALWCNGPGWIIMEQGPIALVVPVGRDCLDIFVSRLSSFDSFSLSLKNGPWERGGGVDGRTEEQAKTNLPLQLLRSWGHNNE